MRVVTGNKYPSDRWIVVDDNDGVVFDPVYAAGNHSLTLKVCNTYVNMPEHRDELHKHYEQKANYEWNKLGYFV
jgi:hypothetical protein